MDSNGINLVVTSILNSMLIFAFSVWLYNLSYMVKSLLESPKLGSSNKNSIPNSHFPKVSVIVPARNEEKNIGKCLESLIDQDYPDLEIIAINDSSVDRTSVLLQQYQTRNSKSLIVLDLKFKPNGWSGKNWACYQGYLRATGELLLFIDADTLLLSPLTISIAVRYLIRESLDTLTARPRLFCEDTWTKVTLPILWIFSHIKYSALSINNPQNKKNGYLFGCFYLITRSAYESVGTHKILKNEIQEDAELGRKLKEENYKLKAVRGEGYIVSIFKADWNGLQRVVIPLYYKDKSGTCLITIGLFFVTLYPFLLLSFSLSMLPLFNFGNNNNNLFVEISILNVLNVATIGLMVLSCGIQLKFGLFENLIYVLATPAGAAIIAFGFIISIICAMRKGVVRWRSRNYTVDKHFTK